MKTKFKRIASLALGLVLALALAAPALAADPATADMSGENGVIGEFTNPDTPTIYEKSVVMYKEITAFNPETTDITVNAPTITYTYKIEPGSAGKDIYDVKTAHTPNANAHVLTKAGITGAKISGSADGTTFVENKLELTPSIQLTANSTGVKNPFKLKVDFSGVTFTGAGVYRYKITEETTETVKNGAGIKDGEISDIRYMDVYVDGDNNIYGYVCFINDNSIDAQEGASTNTVTAAAKTEGFVATTTGGADGATSQTADQYYTFNLEVGKTVENDTYAKTTKHQFPFTVTLDNATVTAEVLPIMTFSDDGTTYAVSATHVTQTALAAAKIGTGTEATKWEPKIADSASVKYVGIPCGTTVTILEQNDVTGATYVSSSAGADTNAEAKNIYSDGSTIKESSNSATVTCGQTALTAATENHTKSVSRAVIFTNKLLQISPTGVVTRIAPFAILLGAGVVLLMAASRRREEEEDA
ncbi:MAG: hypothetical protein IJ713_04040 [Oscillibacter sp.]|nr:hypothetical protein [Oscillibacter sp.]